MAKTATKAPSGYAKLEGKDLRKFDQRARELIFEAQDLGWTFRISAKGHAIGRGPDGHSTFSVADTVDSKYGGSRMMRREFERWKKDNETKIAQRKKLDGAVQGLAKSLVANLARDLITTYTDKSPVDVPETMKVILKRMADQDEVASYMADRIAEGRPTPMILTHDLDSGDAEITDASKPWRIQWVMADPDSHKVIGWGGPKMSLELAQDIVTLRVAAEARAKAEAKQAAIDAATPPARVLPPAPSMSRTTRKKDPAVKMYACQVEGCEAVFEKRQSLASHTLTAHQPRATCAWCGKEFNASAIRRHEPSCENNPSRNDTFECGRCQGVYKITGRGRHEGTCKKLSPEDLAAKRELNQRKRGMTLPAALVPPTVGDAEREQKIAQIAAATPGPIVVTEVEQPPTPAATPPVADTHLSRLAASLPQIADPLSALMNLLAEVEELRAARPGDLQAQIEALTVERDVAIKRAEEAEGKLATLKSVFG